MSPASHCLQSIHAAIHKRGSLLSEGEGACCDHANRSDRPESVSDHDAPDFDGPRLALVGNAPEIGDHARAIDAAACIVRFNNASGFGGRAGSRVTHLALVNRGGQARAWVEEAAFHERAVVRRAGAYLLPFPELSPAEEGAHERVCWTAPLTVRLAGRPVHVLPAALHARAHRLLAPRISGPPNPSTGFLVALAILDARRPDLAPIDVYGFGFAGWPGHPWDAERHCFAAWQEAGRLRLHPPTVS